jgi:hypothetical protein
MPTYIAKVGNKEYEIPSDRELTQEELMARTRELHMKPSSNLLGFGSSLFNGATLGMGSKMWGAGKAAFSNFGKTVWGDLKRDLGQLNNEDTGLEYETGKPKTREQLRAEKEAYDSKRQAEMEAVGSQGVREFKNVHRDFQEDHPVWNFGGDMLLILATLVLLVIFIGKKIKNRFGYSLYEKFKENMKRLGWLLLIILIIIAVIAFIIWSVTFAFSISVILGVIWLCYLIFSD